MQYTHTLTLYFTTQTIPILYGEKLCLEDLEHSALFGWRQKTKKTERKNKRKLL